MRDRTYWTRTWQARMGWWADYGFTTGRFLGATAPAVWRPTQEWALRVATRRIKRRQHADTRRAAAVKKVA